MVPMFADPRQSVQYALHPRTIS